MNHEEEKEEQEPEQEKELTEENYNLLVHFEACSGHTLSAAWCLLCQLFRPLVCHKMGCSPAPHVPKPFICHLLR